MPNAPDLEQAHHGSAKIEFSGRNEVRLKRTGELPQMRTFRRFAAGPPAPQRNAEPVYSRMARTIVSLIGWSRYDISVRSPFLITISAGMPGIMLRLATLSLLLSSTSTRTLK